jgi:hypothetical protein
MGVMVGRAHLLHAVQVAVGGHLLDAPPVRHLGRRRWVTYACASVFPHERC